MQIRIKVRCQWAVRNNGIIKALLTRPQTESAGSQEEHVLLNVLASRGTLEEGREYWVTIDPAFPH